MAEYSTLKVPELKKLLAEKGLPQTGNKADLIARLTEDDKKKGGAPEAAVAEEASTAVDPPSEAPPAGMPYFPPPRSCHLFLFYASWRISLSL